MKISEDKTKDMAINKNKSKVTIEIDGRQIDQIESFRYLAVNVQKDRKEDAEINRLVNITKVYYALNNKFRRGKEIARKTKITIGISYSI